MVTKDTAHKKIAELVERFEDQYSSYKKSEYGETQTRRDFIDPFFKALGWDIDNEQGNAEAYREVIHEDKIKIGKATKAPDYSFRLAGGNRLFFVEAKRPSIFLRDDIQPAYQVRRYGWNAKLAISIITDFEEFAIYDCNKKPNPNDKAAVSRIWYITFRDYLKHFDFIWETFSKERVLKGGLDKFIQESANKRGTATVDKEFLKSLDTWRTYLATSISWNNKNLDEEEINFVVQQTIDRLIFLRIAEDRGVEPYENLHNAVKHGDFYQNLFSIFKEADDKYNSGLFDFKKDQISQSLKIDNKVIKTILNELYYPISPYEFSVLSVEILGSAYEQFLGKTITIDKAHRAKIEEKPEVRKAGGVYYTPQYVVNYIVKNTVGKLVEGKTPMEVSKLKIMDPACGSGSFLIGAYDYLLKYHLDYYIQNPVEAKKENVLTNIGSLTTAIKKQILLNNIYGVDIDVNAVEVTKLSLLLKCLEGETNASIENNQKSMFKQRVLPTLDNNIKSGNSLVDTDIYENQLDFVEEKKIKAFNWEKAFPEVFNRITESPKDDLRFIAQKAKTHAQKALEYVSVLEEKLNVMNEPNEQYGNKGGFDVVIGNPPYLKLTTNNVNSKLLYYYKKKYSSFSGGSSKNLFQLFLEKVSMLSPQIFSFIVPEALLTTDSNGRIRQILLENFNIKSIVTFDHFVFQDATIGTTIIVGDKNRKKITEIIKIDTSEQETFVQEIKLILGFAPWEVSFERANKTFFNKILNSSTLMGEIVEMSKGMVVKNRNNFLLQTPTDKSLPFLLGNCMTRYNYHYDKYAEYEKLNIIGGTRDYGKHTSIPRLLIRRTGSSLCAAYSEKQELIESTIYILRSKKVNLKFLLGLLNSKLLTFYLSKRLVTNSQGFPQVLMGQLAQLPVLKTSEENQHIIIKLVDQLLKLNEEKVQSKLQSKIEDIQGKIDFCEDQINKKVYELYELTPDEIKIVEGK